MISIRQHCIPCYDEISRMETLATKLNIPLDDLFQLEQKTAGGVVKKLHLIVESDWFKQLPEIATIKSGMTDDYIWKKSEVIKEEKSIWKDCKEYCN